MRIVCGVVIVVLIVAFWVLLIRLQNVRWFCRPLWQTGARAAYIEGVACRVWLDAEQ